MRPLPAAPVSAPLTWSQVKPGLEIKSFTIKTLPELWKKMKRDPWERLLELRPDLDAVLERLAARLERAG